MKKVLKRIKTEKGQGLTEYVLILAFIAGVAIAMFGGDGSLKGTLLSTVTKTNNILAGLFGDNKTIAQRMSEWSQYATDAELLENVSSAERLKLDQELLINLANLYLTRNILDVQNDINEFNKGVTLENNATYPHRGTIWNSRTAQTNPDGVTKESNKVQMFKYQEPANTDQTITINDSQNNNASHFNNARVAELISNGAVQESNFNTNQNNAAVSTINQRVFYSDGMINQGNTRTIHARFGIDENTKEVTSVHIYAKQDGTTNAVEGLDLTVRKSGVTYHPTGITYN